MIDHQHVQKWLDDYVAAWKSYDPQAIGALFSEDATYQYSPYDPPLDGRAAIVADWLKNQDAPNTFSAEYRPIAVDGYTAVAQGRTHYFEADGKTPLREFHNLFVLTFDDQGRCTSYVDWFMQPR